MDMTKYYEAAALKKPGCYPQWLSGEQPFWTLAGTEEDEREGLVGEDGTIEAHKRGFTIQPVVRVGDYLVTREEAYVEQSLEGGCLPLPTVEWTWGSLEFRVEVVAYGGKASSLYVRYVLKNTEREKLAGKLYLIVHPMQVYPPWQGGHDGFSPIRSLKYEEGVVRLDGGRSIVLATCPDVFAAKGGTYRMGPVEGDIAEDVIFDRLPSQTEAEDKSGLASGTAVYRFELGERETREVYLAIPLHEQNPEWEAGQDVRVRYKAMRRELVELWESKVHRVEIRISDTTVTDPLKANIAYNLVTRDGVGFQPGSRSYDKSWMRDGAVQALALLKMGFREEVRYFIDWMGIFQQESGEIPPVIDTKREDPLWEEKAGLCEYDGQGEFIHAVWQYYQFTRDRRFLEEQFGRVEKALQFLASLRAKRCTPEYRDGPPEKRACYGILPESRSYESAAGGPFHTYWDDFWALAAWKYGKAMARELGRYELVAGMQDEYEALRKALTDSIGLVMKSRNIYSLPNFVESDAFEPAFTLGALVHGGEMDAFPRAWITATMDRYIEVLRSRRERNAQFVFAPYELMLVPAFLRAGEKRWALEILQFMLGCLRPSGWNQFSEVAASPRRTPRNIGDMPHAWVGAEYIEAVRSLFVYEEGARLIVGAGVDPAWLNDGATVSVTNAPTAFGILHLHEQTKGDDLCVRLWGDANPPAGIILKSPMEGAKRQDFWDGRVWQAVPKEGIRIDQLPAELTIRKAEAGAKHEDKMGLPGGVNPMGGMVFCRSTKLQSPA